MPSFLDPHPKSISDDDLCAGCTHLDYKPGEMSLCRLAPEQGEWPCNCDNDGYATSCPEFTPEDEA